MYFLPTFLSFLGTIKTCNLKSHNVFFLLDEWVEYFAECKSWLVAEQNLKADLKLISGEDKIADEIIGEYGVEGSFRKINLD